LVLLTKYCLGDELKGDEVGGACGMYREYRNTYTGFWLGNLKERYHLKDIGINGRIILKLIT